MILKPPEGFRYFIHVVPMILEHLRQLGDDVRGGHRTPDTSRPRRSADTCVRHKASPSSSVSSLETAPAEGVDLDVAQSVRVLQLAELGCHDALVVADAL